MSPSLSSSDVPSKDKDQSTIPSKLKGAPVPKWLPVSLLAVTTAALVVPILLLRKQKASTLTKALQDSAPPRRAATAGSVRPRPAVPFPAGHPPSPKASGSPLLAQSGSPVSPAPDDFNGAIYSAKAFGYATLIVSAGAVATVLGVKAYMGVQDTQEFAHRMRLAVITYLPRLSARIHRSPEEGDYTATHLNSPDTSPSVPYTANPQDGAEWTWPDAEARLRVAFDKNGLSGWWEVAMRELEAEGQLEKAKRGHP